MNDWHNFQAKESSHTKTNLMLNIYNHYSSMFVHGISLPCQKHSKSGSGGSEADLILSTASILSTAISVLLSTAISVRIFDDVCAFCGKVS